MATFCTGIASVQLCLQYSHPHTSNSPISITCTMQISRCRHTSEFNRRKLGHFKGQHLMVLLTPFRHYNSLLILVHLSFIRLDKPSINMNISKIQQVEGQHGFNNCDKTVQLETYLISESVIIMLISFTIMHNSSRSCPLNEHNLYFQGYCIRQDQLKTDKDSADVPNKSTYAYCCFVLQRYIV